MDEKTFQLLYETHYRAVKNYLYALCKNHADAEDLTQEAFLRYESRLPSFRKECSDYTMLCTIGRNLWLNRQRKEKRLLPLSEQPPDLPEESFEEKLAKEDEALCIHQALHKLPEPYKEVFMLHIFGELNFKKIAALFGKSESWAKMTYFRAKAKIIKDLEEQ